MVAVIGVAIAVTRRDIQINGDYDRVLAPWLGRHEAWFELPNLGALNFLLHGALGGGGTVSLRTDTQGKTFGAALLSMEIEVD